MGLARARQLRLLTAAWVLAAAMRAGVGLSIPCPQIVTDEIRFIGLADEVAHGTWRAPFSPFRDYPFGMYSAVIAPLVRAAPAEAYAAIKVFNAFLMTSLCF